MTCWEGSWFYWRYCSWFRFSGCCCKSTLYTILGSFGWGEKCQFKSLALGTIWGSAWWGQRDPWSWKFTQRARHVWVCTKEDHMAVEFKDPKSHSISTSHCRVSTWSAEWLPWEWTFSTPDKTSFFCGNFTPTHPWTWGSTIPCQRWLGVRSGSWSCVSRNCEFVTAEWCVMAVTTELFSQGEFLSFAGITTSFLAGCFGAECSEWYFAAVQNHSWSSLSQG